MNIYRRIALGGVMLPLISGQVLAEPAGIALSDNINLIPMLSVSQIYDDNFRAVENNPDSSWITTVSPGAELVAESRRSTYRLRYTARHDIFHDYRDEDNTDHDVYAEADLRAGTKSHLWIHAGYIDQTETVSSVNAAEGDQYTRENIGGYYHYGAQGAAGALRLSTDFQSLRFNNSGSLYRAKEYDSAGFGGILYLNYSAQTRVLLEARLTEYDYVTETRLNATNYALLAGVAWDVTRLTQGQVKVGRERKSFDTHGVSSADSSLWEANILWRPLAYSQWTLSTKRALDEGELGASAISSTETRASWQHDWSRVMRSTLAYRVADRDYLEHPQNRRDDTQAISLELSWQLQRWLNLGLGYDYIDTDSNAPNESYRQNVYSVRLSGSL